ncbi:CAP domain-containing protein [Clostridiaceae bacterium M8S5]|nr:CAP domain-containing protein [Clostridiaceae bacterium M8S5]
MLQSKKTKIIMLVILIMIFTINSYAMVSITDLKDINKTGWYYDDVKLLIEKNIIHGYLDNTFRPNDKVKVNEFIKMVVESLNYKIKPVKNDWDAGYINKALEEGLINKGDFDNYDKYISRGEMARIIYNSLDEKYDKDISKYSNQIKDYSSMNKADQQMALKIYSKGIITGFTDGRFGFNMSATRAESSTIIVRMLYPKKRIMPNEAWTGSSDFKYRDIDLGLKESEVKKVLGNPNRIDQESSGYKWYIYNSDYSKFGMVLISKGKVVGYYTNTTLTNVNGLDIGSTIQDINKYYKGKVIENKFIINNEKFTANLHIYDNKILGILVLDSKVKYSPATTQKDLKNMELGLLDIVNAERVKRNLLKLRWSTQANASARKHSKDMVDNNYFGHDSLDGKSAFDRMKNEGINFMAAGENIASGQRNIFDVHTAWMNSSGHRENILSKNYTHLGNGIWLDKSKNYMYYTQNFYKPL